MELGWKAYAGFAVGVFALYFASQYGFNGDLVRLGGVILVSVFFYWLLRDAHTSPNHYWHLAAPPWLTILCGRPFAKLVPTAAVGQLAAAGFGIGGLVTFTLEKPFHSKTAAILSMAIALSTIGCWSLWGAWMWLRGRIR